MHARWAQIALLSGCLTSAAAEDEEDKALIIVIRITPCLCVCLLIDEVFPLDFFGGNNPADVYLFTMRRLLLLPSLSIHYHATGSREASTKSSTSYCLCFYCVVVSLTCQVVIFCQ